MKDGKNAQEQSSACRTNTCPKYTGVKDWIYHLRPYYQTFGGQLDVTNTELFAHAPSDLRYKLSGKYASFTGNCGLKNPNGDGIDCQIYTSTNNGGSWTLR